MRAVEIRLVEQIKILNEYENETSHEEEPEKYNKKASIYDKNDHDVEQNNKWTRRSTSSFIPMVVLERDSEEAMLDEPPERQLVSVMHMWTELVDFPLIIEDN